MAKDFGPGVSGWLDPSGRNWETVVFQAAKPVVDKELNLFQGISGLSKHPNLSSGVFGSDYLDSSEHAQFFVSGTGPNIGQFYGMGARVNGWLIDISNSVDPLGAGFNYLDLGAGPIGAGSHRVDLVVLEVWRKLLSPAPDIDGKSGGGRIWWRGNVKIDPAQDAILNFPDDLFDTNVGAETTKRVQIQYRLRVIPGVDMFAYPDGIDDPTVFAHTVPASAAAPDGVVTTFNYVSQAPDDPGLWRAGDGLPANALDTVDGYMYAVPMWAVFRRNRTAFDRNTNHNGGVPRPGPSDRPDGFFNDIVESNDVVDLRPGMAASGDWPMQELLDKSMNLLLDNALCSEWDSTVHGNGYWGHTVLTADEIGTLPGDGITTGDTPGAEFRGQFDWVRRRFSDRPTYEVVTVQVFGPAVQWVVGDTFAINPTAFEIYPWGTSNWANRVPGTTFIVDALRARYVGGGGGAVCADADIAKIENLGTQPVVTLNGTVGVIPPGITNEDIFIDLLVCYPPGAGLAKTPTLDYGVTNSLYFNNPATLSPALPTFFSTFTNFVMDWPHREVNLQYETLPVQLVFGADTVPGQTEIWLIERASSIIQVLVNAILTPFTLDPTGRIVTVPPASINPGDTITVDYLAIRPIPQNSLFGTPQMTLYSESRMPQTVRNVNLGTQMTVIPRLTSEFVHTLTVGSGSIDEAYPFPFGYVQSPGVYPGLGGIFNGSHDLDARAKTSVTDFNADTGWLKLPMYIGYVPEPQTVVFDRVGTDVDAEARTYFKSVPVGGYLPNAYGQGLSDAKRHKVMVPFIAEVKQSGGFAKDGELVLVVLGRWASFDANNGIYFDTDLNISTSSASVYRLKGNLIGRSG